MGSPDSDNEVKNSQEYKALNDHLSSEETFMQSQSASEVETQLWRVWKAITTIAAQTAHDSPGRQKLANFVLELQKRPQLECKGETCKIWDEAVVWKDLPILGPQMREAWNDGEIHCSFCCPRPSFMQADLDNAQPQPTPRHPLPAAHGSI
jgi:hypothetical protein